MSLTKTLGDYQPLVYVDGNGMQEPVMIQEDPEGIGQHDAGAKMDKGKIRYDLFPPDVLQNVCQILTFGAEKYSENGWKKVPDANKRYYSALMRHLEAWRAGEVIDTESGMPHLSHVLCNVAFLSHLNGDNK